MMKLENTIYSNHKIVVDDNDTPVAVQVDGKIAFRLNDTVRVTGDCQGHICSGIIHSGVGKIVEIRRDDTDHFYGVQMNNGEFGYMKYNRLEHC